MPLWAVLGPVAIALCLLAWHRHKSKWYMSCLPGQRAIFETIRKANYADAVAHVDVRLDQAPGIWLTGVGAVPLSVFDRSRPDAPLQLTVRSSKLSLGLLEGVDQADLALL